jgi:hypothetical protein
MSDEAWEQRVRERAYAIWEREGRPEGGAERHWTMAEMELKAEPGTPQPSTGDIVSESLMGREGTGSTAARSLPA